VLLVAGGWAGLSAAGNSAPSQPSRAGSHSSPPRRRAPGASRRPRGRRSLASPASDAPASSYRIATTDLAVSEPSSPATATERSSAGVPVRIIPTEIWYPLPAADRGRGFPLIVFSPGFDIAPVAYDEMLEAWARAGFVVAEPNYPLTAPSPEGVQESDIVNHPHDLSTVITQLIAASQTARDPLRGRIDPDAIAVAGHSDGGDVSLAVAADSCCSDARVKAAVILSGAELSAFGGRYDTGRPVPLLVVQGTADTINLPGCSAQLYDQAPFPKEYLVLDGAEHEPPYLDPGVTRRVVTRVVLAFLRARLMNDPSALERLARAAALPRADHLGAARLFPGQQPPGCPGAP
jgi:predicted dienelactone hydrolase